MDRRHQRLAEAEQHGPHIAIGIKRHIERAAIAFDQIVDHGGEQLLFRPEMRPERGLGPADRRRNRRHRGRAIAAREKRRLRRRDDRLAPGIARAGRARPVCRARPVWMRAVRVRAGGRCICAAFLRECTVWYHFD
nr:hypothetical protein [Sphingomonas changnyeongensis]